MPFQIIRSDITKVKADVIVNTANPKPVIGSGTDGAIYAAAGEEELLADRKKIGNIARGDIAVTPAYGLKAKYIIHAVGPVWDGGDKGEFDILRDCYRKSLEKASELGCESIAFPLLATGVYMFPKDKALQIAMNEISAFLMREDIDMTVKLVVFDDKAFRLSRNLFFQVESYISDEEVIAAYKKEYEIDEEEYEAIKIRRRREREELASDVVRSVKIDHQKVSSKPFNEHSFDKALYMNDGKVNLPFQNHLIQLMNEKDMDNATVWKSSNITRGAFSKIMCGDTKIPKKKAVLGFCIGMKLSMEEANGLLASADMAFNPYDKRDKLVIECIERGQYNMGDINAMLYICHQPLLGN